MQNFTNVRLLHGPTLEGWYVFESEKYPYYQFECEYDGTDVGLDFIPVYYNQPSLHKKLKILHGLLNDNSNFKKELFNAFSFVKNKKLEKILYEYIDFVFIINKNSNIDELIREYYRAHHYMVLDTDTEEDILSRSRKKQIII